MNIIVLIKQVPDTETKVRITADKRGIETNDIKWVINPYDEFAIEEGLKTKERLKEGLVSVVTVGPDRTVEALRTAVAMGADNAIHVKTESVLDTYLVAKALAEVCKKENANIIFTGKQAIDDDQAATFGYVAELLQFPSASVVVKCDISPDKSKATVEQEGDGGAKNVIETSLPAVLAVNKGINTPRYASLPGIMKAKKKEIKTYTLTDLGLGAENSKTIDSDYQLPPERAAGKKLQGDASAQAKELVRLLREEAKVI
ncbi:MAG: electron transfer flavoprotein subunit beta/FixA family protein [Proteobacteria bacterium]|nr:electron transfer flavoprotein subunit beta/FixA family protein [Pseudomonadota bacterium]NBY19760.1 electron transfer flavoprotein subunit beta/FixA family protein [bacterium]